MELDWTKPMDDDIDASLELQHGATEGDLTSRQDKARTSDVVKGSLTSGTHHSACAPNNNTLSAPHRKMWQCRSLHQGKDDPRKIPAQTGLSTTLPAGTARPSAPASVIVGSQGIRRRARHNRSARSLAACLPTTTHTEQKKTDTARLNIGLSPPFPFTQAMGGWGRPDRPDYVTETSHSPSPTSSRAAETQSGDDDDEDRGGGAAGQKKTRQDRTEQNKRERIGQAGVT